jgi:hypothetical protein
MRNVQNWWILVVVGCSSASPTWTNADLATEPKKEKSDPPSDGTPGGETPPGSTPPPSSPESTDGGSDAGDDDAAIYSTPVQCSSGTHWTSGNTGSADMQPGSSCNTCHVVGGSASGKTWDISGTVYPTAHEPDDCNGTSVSGVTIVITDAKGVATSLPVNAVGNFNHADLFGFAKIATPYTAKVVSGGKERVMVTPQTDGNCNSCHTVSGAKSAPGRIMMP